MQRHGDHLCLLGARLDPFWKLSQDPTFRERRAVSGESALIILVKTLKPTIMAGEHFLKNAQYSMESRAALIFGENTHVDPVSTPFLR